MGIRRSKSDMLDVFEEERDNATTGRNKESLPNCKLQDLLIQNTEIIQTISSKVDLLAEQVKNNQMDMDEVIDNVCNKITYALEHVVFKGHLVPDDLDMIKKVAKDALLEKERVYDLYLKKCDEQLENHERKLRQIMERNEGIWLSSFWMKVCIVTFYVYMLVTYLCTS